MTRLLATDAPSKSEEQIGDAAGSSPIRIDPAHLAEPGPRWNFYKFRELANLFEKLDTTFGKMTEICRSEQASAERLCEASADLRMHDFSKTPEWDKHPNDNRRWRVLIVDSPEGWEPCGLDDIPPGITAEQVRGSWGEFKNGYKATCFCAGWNVLHMKDVAKGRRWAREGSWAMAVPFESPLDAKPPEEPAVESTPREYYSAQVHRPEGWIPTSPRDNPPELLQVLFWEDMLYETEENTLEGAMEATILHNETAMEDMKAAKEGGYNPPYWHVVVRIPNSERDDGSFVFHPGSTKGILTVHRLFKPEWIKFDQPTA